MATSSMNMATHDTLTLPSHQLGSRYAGRLRPAEVNLLHLWRKGRYSWHDDDDDDDDVLSSENGEPRCLGVGPSMDEHK